MFSLINDGYIYIIIFLTLLISYTYSMNQGVKYYHIFLNLLWFPFLIYLTSDPEKIKEIFQFDVLFLIIGLLIAPLITIITCKIFFNKNLKLLLPKMNVKIIYKATLEEFLWRNLILSQMILLLSLIVDSKVAILAAVIISTITFVLAHSRKNNLEYLEMFVFSLLITIAYLVYPGLNIGLHVGRNLFILANRSV